MGLISVAECASRILAKAPFEGVSLPLTDALGKVLAKDMHAREASPPFDRVAMDGIAIAFDAHAKGRRHFISLGLALAGKPPLVLADSSACIEVATGAVLPKGCDTVIPYEHLKQNGQSFMIKAPVVKRQNVHEKGSDHKAGHCVLADGTQLFAPQIAALAAMGESEAFVYGLLSAHIVATGEELYLACESVPDYGIYCSSAPALAAMLSPFMRATWEKVGDNPKRMEEVIAKSLLQSDCLVITGAVSKGEPDVVPEILQKLGADIVLHGVSQKPGKPFLFATHGEKFIFALPGNPVSALVVARRYLIPFLLAAMKLQDRMLAVGFAAPLEIKNETTHFIPVFFDGGQVTPVPMTGSGDWSALANSAGFIEVQKNSGQEVPFYPWRMAWS